jgi:hypothetical protein
VSSSNDKIGVQWAPVPRADAGGKIMSYNIRWRLALPGRNEFLTADLWGEEEGFSEVFIN